MRILSAEGWAPPNWDAKDSEPDFSLAEEYTFRRRTNALRTIHFGTRMVGSVLLAYGTPEQRKRYLPKILTSEEI